MAGRYLLVTDGSEQSQKAESFITSHCDPESTTVSVLTVAEEFEYFFTAGVGGYTEDIDKTAVQKQLKDNASRVAQEAASRLEEVGYDVEAEVVVGRPGKEIVRWAHENGVSAIVMGRRGVGRISEMMLGSVSQYVLSHASCPVVVVPGRE